MLGHSQTKMVDTTVNEVWLYSMNYKHAHVPFLDLRDLQVKCSLMEEHARLDRGLEQTISAVYDRAKRQTYSESWPGKHVMCEDHVISCDLMSFGK